VIGLHGNAADDACGRRSDLTWIGRIGLGMSALDYAQRAIADVHFARLAVQFKKERASAVGMRLADGQKLDDEGFSGFDFDGDLFAGLQAVEKYGGGQNADIRIGMAKSVVLAEDDRT